MMKENLRMKWWASCVCLLTAALIGCTKPNPKSCADGLCTDQRYPFCDVDGTLGGEANECIAVTCTAGEFASCRGDQEIRCNATGNDYELVQCELGCSAATDGCRLCEPSQTRCTNGTVATCDANGNVVAMTACALGCFDDQPRCRSVDPSNGLGMYLDMFPSPPDIEFQNVSINTSTGVVTNNVTQQPLQGIQSYVAANGGGPPIRVYVGNNVRLEDVTIQGGSANTVTGTGVAFVAKGPITVEGTITVAGSAGGVNNAGCTGGNGGFIVLNDTVNYVRGSGGGAHATGGGSGGAHNSTPGGTGGAASGNDTLEPLRGGCPAGGSVHEYYNDTYPPDVPGGGAIQLSSETSIDVRGKIDVRGSHGYYDAAFEFAVIYGGGAGGGVLLEAPAVTLGADAKIIAKGGGGGAYVQDSVPEDDTIMPSQGTVCPGACSDGGDGAAPGLEATSGESTGSTTGGGGGGMGRLRINTKDGTYAKVNTSVEGCGYDWSGEDALTQLGGPTGRASRPSRSAEGHTRSRRPDTSRYPSS